MRAQQTSVDPMDILRTLGLASPAPVSEVCNLRLFALADPQLIVHQERFGRQPNTRTSPSGVHRTAPSPIRPFPFGRTSTCQHPRPDADIAELAKDDVDVPEGTPKLAYHNTRATARVLGGAEPDPWRVRRGGEQWRYGRAVGEEGAGQGGREGGGEGRKVERRSLAVVHGEPEDCVCPCSRSRSHLPTAHTPIVAVDGELVSESLTLKRKGPVFGKRTHLAGRLYERPILGHHLCLRGRLCSGFGLCTCRIG